MVGGVKRQILSIRGESVSSAHLCLKAVQPKDSSLFTSALNTDAAAKTQQIVRSGHFTLHRLSPIKYPTKCAVVL